MRPNLSNRRYRAAALRYLLRAQANRCFYCDCWLAKPLAGPADAGAASEPVATPIPMGCEPNSATFDHLRPTARGGDDHLSNLAIACLVCNQLKGNRTALEFFGWLAEHPIRDEMG